MALTFNGTQRQVDELVNQHPDGYRSNEKIFNKMGEEKLEIQEALKKHQGMRTENNLKKLKTEIGDGLFSIICITNSTGIDLDECFNLMMEKNRNRAKNNYQKE